ncbi:MAG: M3 family metallopeptidase, partial [Planctomycetota bacterium]
PLLRDLHRARRDRLGLPALRPWDMQVDVSGRPPLRPFRKGDELVSLVRRVFDRLEPEFARRIDWMDRSRLLDLDAREGKAPGGYMCGLDERRVPFIFMNAAGLQADVNTLLHEGGHAFHLFEARDHDLAFNRSAPIEFCEVASMSMELAGLERIDGAYREEDARRARLEHLESVVRILCWVCSIDSFQLDLYARPGHTREERRALWLDAFRRFRGEIDYAGLEDAEARRWHMQSHLFVHALYYIEYAIAQIGALQIWRNIREDRARGLAAYRRGLALGNTRPLPSLFEAAGARFDFGERTVGEVTDLLRREIETLQG